MKQINYLDDLMSEFTKEGINQELQNLLDDDINFLSELNVKNDRQRNLAFYLDHFCDDLCTEFGYKVDDRKPVIIRAFYYLKDLDNIDLTKIRAGILKALREIYNKKVAYPNTAGVNESNIQNEANISLWVNTLKEIYLAVRAGENRQDVFQRITEGWSPMEKSNFEAWARYYEKGDHEKYNIKTAASWPMSFLDESEETNDEKLVEKPIAKKQKSPEDMKRALISRLNSAEKLLYSFVHVWPNDVYNRLHQGLSDLKREIMMMRTASSMRDRIIRTASLWELNGFLEGASELRKIAQPPESDITSQIEKALTGREFEDTDKAEMAKENKPALPAEMPEMPPGMTMPLEGPGDTTEEQMPGGLEMPPAGVEENLPPIEQPPSEGMPEEKEEKGDIDVVEENPYAGATVQDVLEVLQPLSQKLREREFIRDLSKADMMLDALNIASHFPELGEAQAKALELNIYVGSRVEKVIVKLKGGLKEEEEESEEKEEAPNIDMGELGMPEETAFEVSEQEPTVNPEEKPVETKENEKISLPEKKQ